MKKYATLLNLDYAEEHSLEFEDLFEPRLQESLLHRMACGTGASEEESLDAAINNLISEGVIATYECRFGAGEVLQRASGKDALRHLWLHDDQCGDDPKLLAVPGHDTIVAFCDRYGLPEKAKRELAAFLDVALHRN